jgi:RNA polymerase sigma-70 factor, ECF subfamily
MTREHDPCTTAAVPELVEHLFRRQAGRMLATLCRIFGFENLDLAEELVQETMLKALRLWPFHGIPDDPAAWLMRAARNEAIDQLRRRAALKRTAETIAERLQAAAAQSRTTASHAADDDALDDDQLAMIFACCHPALPPDGRVALTLKAVSGLSTAEIARAFLVKEETIAQRLVRAKRRIQDGFIALSLPAGSELSERFDSVLRVVYLTFNEGYTAHQGRDLVRPDLCAEAIRVGSLLVQRPETNRPKTHALLALLLFQASRLPARVDSTGNLLLLRDQDRAAWDRDLIDEGMRHLDLAAAGDELTEYHVQAAIASVHAITPSFDQTDWPYLLELYDQLMCVAPSPTAALNRLVVVAEVEGAAPALELMEELADEPALANYYLTHATRAELLSRLGRHDEASQRLRRALSLECSEPERRFLENRLVQVSGEFTMNGPQARWTGTGI